MTDISIIELQGIGQRQDGVIFELVDSARNSLGMLDVARAPTINFDTTHDTSMRTASGVSVSTPPATLDLNRERVRVWLTLENGSAYPLGVFMFGENASKPYAMGTEWTPQLFDEGFLLAQDLGRTYAVKPGDSLLGAFKALAGEVLDPLGIPSQYPVGDATVVAVQTFVAGSARMTALKTIASALGCYPPFFDNDGVFRLRIAPPVDVPPDHVYELGGRIIDGSSQITESMYRAPSHYVVIGADLKPTEPGGEVRGEYWVPASAPYSAFVTGREVKSVATVPAITTNELAAAAAFTNYLTNSRVSYGKVTFGSTIDPRHRPFDIMQHLGLRYVETSWTIDLGSQIHTHVGTRLW